MNRLTIYNDRSIQILDAVLFDHLIETAEVSMPIGAQGLVILYYPYGDDQIVDEPVVEATIPPSTHPRIKESVWRRTTMHLSRSLREVKAIAS